ncbi:hypothetical protein R1flu_008555 [Riccia fluitans]|uniref:Uncharacterized protein n=1 Tax=Riccia fluitans TaxID=41844 RepID=A0ABD1YC86_9MARC
MLIAMEQLRRIALFDGEAKLMPNLRPAWMKVMESQTMFARYPGLKPDELSSLEFWTLDHCGILPYYMRMQAEATPTTVFFSMIGNSAIVKREEEKTERLMLRGIDGNEVMVTPALIRRAFGITVKGIQSERNGVLYPTLATIRFQEVAEKGENKCRCSLPAVSAFLDLMWYWNVGWTNMLAGGLALAVKEYVWKFNRGQDPGIVKVDWVPALVQIVREGRNELFGSPLNCPALWEELDNYTSSPEQAGVLWGMHAENEVTKDSLYGLLRLDNAPPQSATSQGAPGTSRPAEQ